MRAFIPLTIALFVVAAVPAAESGGGDPEPIDMTGTAFATVYTLPVVELEAGDSVFWTNSDLIGIRHTATADDVDENGDPLFDTGTLFGDDVSAVFTFEDPGTFTYRCLVHPQTMHGVIIVE